jgi:hypothetical protein
LRQLPAHTRGGATQDERALHKEAARHTRRRDQVPHTRVGGVDDLASAALNASTDFDLVHQIGRRTAASKISGEATVVLEHRTAEGDVHTEWIVRERAPPLPRSVIENAQER